MTPWTRESALRWIEGHANREIVLRQRSSALRVQGICKGVEHLDACSAHYQECELIPAGVDVEVTLCFHAETLAVHMIAYHPQSGEVTLSMPISVPFAELLLHEPGESALDEQAQKEPTFSPYELL
ncbi:MAG: hypothetical protein HY342_04430 [Candidatus Lambdaproteobacteria bacterium]|nr:hypothetical protein [Candidatus Lambdaproteobacteria bacterium]